MKPLSIALSLVFACMAPSAANAQSTTPAPSTVEGPPMPVAQEPSAAPAAPGTRFAEAMAKMDPNGDGAITLAEWTGAGRRDRGFKMLDDNSDGKLTMEEIKSGIAKLRSARGRSR